MAGVEVFAEEKNVKHGEDFRSPGSLRAFPQTEMPLRGSTSLGAHRGMGGATAQAVKAGKQPFFDGPPRLLRAKAPKNSRASSEACRIEIGAAQDQRHGFLRLGPVGTGLQRRQAECGRRGSTASFSSFHSHCWAARMASSGSSSASCTWRWLMSQPMVPMRRAPSESAARPPHLHIHRHACSTRGVQGGRAFGLQRHHMGTALHPGSHATDDGHHRPR